MTNPTDLQRFMAELMGWTELKIFTDYKDDACEYPVLLGGLNPENGRREVVPNWLNDRNASYDLIKDFPREVMMKIQSNYAGPLSASAESKEYIKYRGYKWMECPLCDGSGEVEQRDTGGVVIGLLLCLTCSGEKGKFVKV